MMKRNLSLNPINTDRGGQPLLVFGSLQKHHATASVNEACPTIACTDFGLPRIVELYEDIRDEES